MARIGLIDVDGHHFPNLALMKISAYHKKKGDDVEWCIPLKQYDIVYQRKVFDKTYSEDIDFTPQAKQIIKGGTGYGLENFLPDEIEHMFPDYSLYSELTKNTAYGFLTRGCPRQCHFCIVSEKEGRKSHKVANVQEFWDGQKYIKLLDANILACKEHMELLQQLADTKAYVDFTQGLDARLLTEQNIEMLNKIKKKEVHFAWDYMSESDKIIQGLQLYKNLANSKPHGHYATVYCLVNYNTTMDENLYRINTLRDMGYAPYVMVYNKPSAPKDIKMLQRWVNNKVIFHTVSKFEDYQRSMKAKKE